MKNTTDQLRAVACILFVLPVVGQKLRFEGKTVTVLHVESDWITYEVTKRGRLLSSTGAAPDDWQRLVEHALNKGARYVRQNATDQPTASARHR